MAKQPSTIDYLGHLEPGIYALLQNLGTMPSNQRALVTKFPLVPTWFDRGTAEQRGNNTAAHMENMLCFPHKSKSEHLEPNILVTMQAAEKLGIVYIGKAGGKHKYSLLDEKDIHLVKRFRFEAKVDVNKNGNGANIFAYAFDLSREETSGYYFHEYIWERHCGGVAPGFRVCHKNGVTVDNRLNNLCVLPSSSKSSNVQLNHAKSNNNCGSEPREDQRLYWMAVSRLPPFDVEHEHFMNLNYKCYNANGEQVTEEDDTLSFYECHYPPCCKIETELREFSICGQCQQVRYCGPLCQERDWPSHKKYCKEKAKQRLSCEVTPER